MEGLVNFYKPTDWRNQTILKFFKQLAPSTTKIGHGGTLDPLAEGVMVIGLGRKFTQKLKEILLTSKKDYTALIVFGKSSTTYDAEGSIQALPLTIRPNHQAITKLIESDFLGNRQQLPPLFSAKKISGRRSADLARSGKIANLTPQLVTLFNYKILDYSFPLLKIQLLVSSGFYIRSFAHELGQKLGLGAYLKQLTRTAIITASKTYSANQALAPVDFAGRIELSGWVRGNVQGVGFRFFLYQLARTLGISGTVANQPDGSVSFIGQGKLEPLVRFANQAKQGPASAQVSDYYFNWHQPTKPLQGFVIR